MSEENSILDKIITSKQTSDMSQFNPLETVSSLLKLITDKEEDILRRRYGLNGKKEETLEEIGKFYKVTRERIRQVENSSVSKIKSLKNFSAVTGTVENIISSLMHQNGGIMEKEFFYKKLLSVVGDKGINKNAVNFLMSRLFNEKYKVLVATGIRECWQLKTQSASLLMKAVEVLYTILEKSGRPLDQDKILSLFKENELYAQEPEFFTDDVIISYLNCAKKISMNPYGDYGLTKWGSINPKRINDKIFLVMKKHGKPLHFTKIAELINKANFDNKKAYPPTVHNELILNSDYVLVGRGIYALKEWGYKSGIVSDVLVGILKNADKPMNRNELVNKVLEKRMVKKNTILLALTNKEKFKKLPDNTYTLV